MSPEFSQIVDALQRESSFLITSHVNPDVDSIASQLATLSALSCLGKRSVIVNEDPVPDWLRFLPGSEGVRGDLPENAQPRIAVVLDAADLGRLGRVREIVARRGLPVINIDHHPSNLFFGRFNLVLPEMSSTAEILVEVIRALGAPIDRPTATNLYAGILGDTGSFRYANTTARVLRVAADLVDAGAQPHRIANGVYYSRSIGAVRLLGEMLTTYERALGGRVGVLTLSRAGLESSGAAMDESNGYATWALSAGGTEIGMLLRELEDGKVRVSLRSKETFDVGAVARSFGGGGHVAAAGCVLEGSPAEVKELVLSKIREVEPQ